MAKVLMIVLIHVKKVVFNLADDRIRVSQRYLHIFLKIRYICFPQSSEELEQKRQEFALNTNIPGVIDILDGTHVHLAGLLLTDEE